MQAALEDALSLIFREPCSTVVAGRTDTGVHARHQTVHVDVPLHRWEQQSRRRDVAGGVVPGTVPTQHDAGGTEAGMPVPELTRRLNGALNRVLGKDRAAEGWAPAVGAVVVRDVSVADVGFDARFSALSAATSTASRTP